MLKSDTKCVVDQRITVAPSTMYRLGKGSPIPTVPPWMLYPLLPEYRQLNPLPRYY